MSELDDQIKIEIDGEDAIAPAKPAPAPIIEERPQKSQKREKIASLKHENITLAEQNQQLLYALEERNRQIEEREAALREHENLLASYKKKEEAHLDESYEREENDLLAALKEAKLEGDIDREVLLSRELNRLNAEQAKIDIFRSVGSVDEEPETYFDSTTPWVQPRVPVQYTPPAPQMSEAALDFIDKNPWADPQAEEYNPKLVQKADDFAAQLKKSYQENGIGDQIGTPSFFDSVSNIVNKIYAPQPASAAPSTSLSNPIGSYEPEGRQTMADIFKSENGWTGETLSSKESAFLHNIIASNGGVVYGPEGKPLTQNEILAQYKAEKAAADDSGTLHIQIT